MSWYHANCNSPKMEQIVLENHNTEFKKSSEDLAAIQPGAIIQLKNGNVIVEYLH